MLVLQQRSARPPQALTSTPERAPDAPSRQLQQAVKGTIGADGQQKDAQGKTAAGSGQSEKAGGQGWISRVKSGLLGSGSRKPADKKVKACSTKPDCSILLLLCSYKTSARLSSWQWLQQHQVVKCGCMNDWVVWPWAWTCLRHTLAYLPSAMTGCVATQQQYWSAKVALLQALQDLLQKALQILQPCNIVSVCCKTAGK